MFVAYLDTADPCFLSRQIPLVLGILLSMNQGTAVSGYAINTAKPVLNT